MVRPSNKSTLFVSSVTRMFRTRSPALVSAHQISLWEIITRHVPEFG